MTLQRILINATKYMEDSIATRNIPAFARKPTKGGTPAIEKKTMQKINANVLFDFSKSDKSPKSLLDLPE